MDRFREMRRKDRELSKNEALEILEKGMWGTLCLNGDGSYPQGFPVNYVVTGDRVMIHHTCDGGLMSDLIARDDRACLTVVERMEGARSRSAMAFGHIVRDDSLREETLGRIVDKYVPEPGRSDAKAGIPRAVGNMVALRLDIEHITGKYVDKPGR